MSTLVLTCAGKSERYPGYRPKWSLTHPNGNMMAAESVAGLRGYKRIVAAFNESDWCSFGNENIATEFQRAGVEGVELVNIGASSSHVETISRALLYAKVEGAFTAKDCDNRFGYDLADPGGNCVAVASLMDTGKIQPGNKSYVGIRDGWVEHVAERTLLSEFFCCGAYSFERPAAFLAHADGNRYVSGVIASAIRAGEAFRFSIVDDGSYVDWGTADDWRAYRAQYRTLFVDVDGVLVRSSHRSFEPRWGESKVIERNIAYLNRLHATGKVEVILTTSRPESCRELTVSQLEGLSFDRLVMGLRTCARYVVNDHAPERGEPTCFAIGLDRDSDMLQEAFGGTG